MDARELEILYTEISHLALFGDNRNVSESGIFIG